MLEFADMTLSYLLRIQLLLLFALLQCVTPLAHAHVNGNNVGQAAHMPLYDVTIMHGHQHEFENAHLSTEEHHDVDAVIGMQPESRSSVLVVDLPVLPTQRELLPHDKSVTRVLDNLHTVSFALTPYRHPFSQAPPF